MNSWHTNFFVCHIFLPLVYSRTMRLLLHQYLEKIQGTFFVHLRAWSVQFRPENPSYNYKTIMKFEQSNFQVKKSITKPLKT